MVEKCLSVHKFGLCSTTIHPNFPVECQGTVLLVLCAATNKEVTLVMCDLFCEGKRHDR